jgi:hypothetical protein
MLVPTVYSRVKWARCKLLHPKELLTALDVPANIKGKIMGGIMQHFVNLPVPGKTWMHVLHMILGKRLGKKRTPAERVTQVTSKKKLKLLS